MSNCRVMVVDENPKFRNAIMGLIAERGFEAYPAADGIDALRQIYDVKPEVIVADAVLSDLSGFKFLPFVRRRFPNIGVIAMKEEGIRALPHTEVIADEVCSKAPLDLTHFLGLLDELSNGTARKRPAAIAL